MNRKEEIQQKMKKEDQKFYFTLFIIYYFLAILSLISFSFVLNNFSKESNNLESSKYNVYLKEIPVEILNIDSVHYYVEGENKTRTLITVYNSDYNISEIFLIKNSNNNLKIGSSETAVLKTTAKGDNDTIIKRELIELKGAEN